MRRLIRVYNVILGLFWNEWNYGNLSRQSGTKNDGVSDVVAFFFFFFLRLLQQYFFQLTV